MVELFTSKPFPKAVMKGQLMRLKLLVGTLLFLTTMARTQTLDRGRYVQIFKLWGVQKSQFDKASLLIGFTNGYFMGRGEEAGALWTCLDKKVDLDQAIAMIDKYYQANPEKWSDPFGWEILSALTVKDGPCPLAVPH